MLVQAPPLQHPEEREMQELAEMENWKEAHREHLEKRLTQAQGKQMFWTEEVGRIIEQLLSL